MKTHVDVKAYAVGELSAQETQAAAAHVAGCEACREELAGVQATLSSLAMLREEEAPRRIAFVSDKVFEPRWWQRWNPTFASACVLAAAIVFHAFASQQGPSEAAIQAAVSKEMQPRLEVLNETDKRVTQMYRATMQLVSY